MADVEIQKQRIAMAIEFDGRVFHGWQQQDNATSVQAELQAALLAVEGETVVTVAAGRTDSGVHAEALLVHADVSSARWQRSHLAYLHGLNSRLPDSIRVVGVRAVKADFHARFDCRGRTYRYQISNRNTLSALHRWRYFWVPRALNLEAMQEAAAHCIGRHDFSSLRASGCQAAHAIRTMSKVDVSRDGFAISIEVAGDGFLYHMVRNLVGNLVEVGLGKQTPEQFRELLAQQDRSRGAATAPAHGLYFIDALYDDFSASDLIGKS